MYIKFNIRKQVIFYNENMTLLVLLCYVWSEHNWQANRVMTEKIFIFFFAKIKHKQGFKTLEVQLQDFTCMQANMYFQTSWGRKALHTVLTLKSLNSRVRFYMRCESTLHSKGPETLWTFEWLFMSVNAYMPYEITGFFKFLRAVWANMPSYSVFLTYGTWNIILE